MNSYFLKGHDCLIILMVREEQYKLYLNFIEDRALTQFFLLTLF